MKGSVRRRLRGPGGSGKTNLLEAVFLFCGTGDPRLLQTLLGLRQIAAEVTARDLRDPVEWFLTVGRAEPIVIRGLWKEAHRTVAIMVVFNISVPPISIGD